MSVDLGSLFREYFVVRLTISQKTVYQGASCHLPVYNRGNLPQTAPCIGSADWSRHAVIDSIILMLCVSVVEGTMCLCLRIVLVSFRWLIVDSIIMIMCFWRLKVLYLLFGGINGVSFGG